MADAQKGRAGLFLRRTACLLLAATLGGGLAFADDRSQAPAPIIYAKPASTARTVRLDNSIQTPPPAVAPSANAPLTFDQFQGRAPVQEQRVEPAAYGPIVPSFAPAPLAPSNNALQSMKTAPAAGFAAPFAGPPYQIEGRWYVPAHEPNYDEVGVASWYGPGFHAKASATGEEFDQDAFTAAHPTLPLPSLVRVTNLENGRSMVVRLNDRGPFVDDRIIDLSRATAQALGVIDKGTAKVRVQYVGPAPSQANMTLPDAQPPRQAVRVSAPQSAPAVLATEPSPAFDEAPLIPAEPELAGQGRQPVVAAANDKGFFLQAGTFADLGNAHRLRDQMRAFWPAQVEPARIGDSEYFRVMLGPWASREDAEMAKERLAQTGAKSLLIARLD